MMTRTKDDDVDGHDEFIWKCNLLLFAFNYMVYFALNFNSNACLFMAEAFWVRARNEDGNEGTGREEEKKRSEFGHAIRNTRYENGNKIQRLFHFLNSQFSILIPKCNWRLDCVGGHRRHLHSQLLVIATPTLMMMMNSRLMLIRNYNWQIIYLLRFTCLSASAIYSSRMAQRMKLTKLIFEYECTCNVAVRDRYVIQKRFDAFAFTTEPKFDKMKTVAVITLEKL